MGRLNKDTTLTFTRFTDSQQIDPVTRKRSNNVVESTFEASGVLEPYSLAGIMYQLPQGKRTDRAYYFFTDTLLLTGTDTGDRRAADRTTINGETFEVYNDGNYAYTSNPRLQTYEAVLIKVVEEQS